MDDCNRGLHSRVMEGARIVEHVSQSDAPDLYCEHPADNDALSVIVKKLRVLRQDAYAHGELLATLSVPQNRDAIRRGDSAILDQLFELVDTWDEGHKHRMASIDAAKETPQ
jgi:hypothetical protein